MPHGYDLNSDLTSMTNPTGIVTNYVYDTLNRLAGITDSSDVYISSYTYDSLNRRVEKKLPNIAAPLTTSYTYDLASQLKSITNMPVNISNYYDNYDNVGNRLNMTDSTGTHNYTYDNLYRLTDSSNPSENYSYDPVGNRNPITQTYDSGNRLLENDTYTYTYDLNGNMTSKTNKTSLETTSYAYNSEDQLIGVNNNITYKYDALGRRIEKNVSGTITRYIYNGEDIIQEYDSNNQIIATYTHGPGIDEPISVEKNGQKYYYIADGLGSITAIVDQSGNIAQTYRYDSFGNIINSSGTIAQPFTYTGREYDPETGLFYYRNRFYDARIGRFLQEDPLGLAGGINYYAYVGNDPINLKDPLGLIWVTVDTHNHVNLLRRLINRGTVIFGNGLKDNPSVIASDPNEWVGTKRDVIQEWRPDFNNSCLDSMYPYGTKRIVTQDITVNLAGSPRNELTNAGDEGLYYQYDPWVNSPTYKEFANQEIIYPKDQNYIFIQQIMEGRNGR